MEFNQKSELPRLVKKLKFLAPKPFTLHPKTALHQNESESNQIKLRPLGRGLIYLTLRIRTREGLRRKRKRGLSVFRRKTRSSCAASEAGAKRLHESP